MSDLFDELGFRGGPALADILGGPGQQEWADRFKTLLMSERCDMIDLIRVPAVFTFRVVPRFKEYMVIDQVRRSAIRFERSPGGGFQHAATQEPVPHLLASLLEVVERVPQHRYSIEWPAHALEVLGEEMSWSGP